MRISGPGLAQGGVDARGAVCRVMVQSFPALHGPREAGIKVGLGVEPGGKES